MVKIRNRHFILIDLFSVAITPTLALTLRVLSPWEDNQFIIGLVIYTILSIIVKLPVFNFFNLYRRYWRYASINEMLSIIRAVMVASIILMGVFFGLHIFCFFSELALHRTVPVIDILLTLVAVGGSRFSIRALLDRKARPPKNEQTKRVLIVGAGDAGEIVAREIFTSGKIYLDLVGYVDDNPEKIGAYIHGRPVLGPLADLPKVVDKYDVQEVIIAMPAVSGKVVRKVLEACEEVDVSAKMVPGMYELLSGHVSVDRLREIEIGDLLRRELVHIDSIAVEALITGKRVLVSGAGGSIGSELCAQISKFQPDQITLLGHGENSLYSLYNKLSTLIKIGNTHINLKLVVGDVRDKQRLTKIFESCLPDIVFHAAAHKHVPIMEDNIEEAITNNVLGTLNIVELAKNFSVERFVFISTDKAVQPVSVMGMTKRLAELIVRMVAMEANRPFVSVRFGNVLGSRGSVVPLFQRQIAAGGPVTVTDPEMTRYFMTIPEAVQLVLQASTLGTNGEVFVLDMGEPVKIVDLAKDIINLSGYEIGRDIEIVFTGIRPGERLFEELFAENESYNRTVHQKIFVTSDGALPAKDSFFNQVDRLINLAKEGESDSVKKELSRLIAMN